MRSREKIIRGEQCRGNERCSIPKGSQSKPHRARDWGPQRDGFKEKSTLFSHPLSFIDCVQGVLVAPLGSLGKNQWQVHRKPGNLLNSTILNPWENRKFFKKGSKCSLWQHIRKNWNNTMKTGVVSVQGYHANS